MRMRRKPNLLPRIARCASIYTENPRDYRGGWSEIHPGFQGVYLELGCGKGRFTCELAESNPQILLVAVEKNPDVMVIAMERAMAAGLTNIRFVKSDVSEIPSFFAPGEVLRICINFCDPWPSRKHEKRRLTNSGFLNLYRQVLPTGGEIHFKTDNAPLFSYSLSEFEKAGFPVGEITGNLHENGSAGIMTDYELKFHGEGIPIHRCVAKKES